MLKTFVSYTFILDLLKLQRPEVLEKLCHALNHRVYIGDWLVDEGYKPEISVPWISPAGVRFSLRRRERSGHLYWYLTKGRKSKYVGKELSLDRLSSLAANW